MIGPRKVRAYPSVLDSFERHLFIEPYDGQDRETPKEFADRLCGKAESAVMERGSRFHKALEQMSLSGGEFDCEGVGWKIDIELEHPSFVEERRAVIRQGVELGLDSIDEVVLSGRADAIMSDGTIVDYKTTQKAIALEPLIDSWQWRSYLTLWPEAPKFRYEVFRFKQDRRKGSHWDVVEHQSVELRPYSTMAAELWRHAALFAGYAVRLENEDLLRIDDDGRFHAIEN